VLDAFALRFVEGHRAAAPKLREAIDVVRCVDDPQCMMFGCWAASELWDEESLGELARRWVELAREAGEPITLARALANRSAVWEVAVGRLDAAEASVDEARRVFAAVGALDVPERTDGARLIVAAWRGRDEEARALARSTMRGAIRRGRGASINLAYHGLAVLEIARGDYRAALALARKANEHDGAYLPNWTLPELVEAACRSGERDLAASAERRLADTVVAGSSEWGYGVLAQSRALRTEGAHAEALYREAIERLSNSRMRPQLARARLVYGEWLRRGRRRREAREQLTTAHELFDSMGMMGFAKRTAIELLATGERVGNPTGAPAKVLTPREAEIARRAAEGASNPDIAAQLYISQRTVEYHLHKVFRKLNITSRTQLARALVESSATDC
jgi:DNA-binding CsgD family transcriptional regulator